MELITINTAIALLERLLHPLSELQDDDLDNLLRLIRKQFQRHTLSTQLLEDGSITEELISILETITPDRICAAVAMDELGPWCEAIQEEVAITLKGMKIRRED